MQAVKDFHQKAVLTVDIVEFSRKPQFEQAIVTQVLIELLKKAVPEDYNNRNNRIWSPAGDGGCLTFWDSTFAAIKTAVDLGRLVKRYNRYVGGEIYAEKIDGRLKDVELLKSEAPISIRTGIHIGAVVKQTDFDDRENIWGIGINVASRVASLAEPDQIVVSEAYYKGADLEHHKEYDIQDIGIWWAKHGLPLKLYNVYVQDKDEIIGIPSEQVEGWHILFERPLQSVVNTYVKMLEDEKIAYRALVLAKRILDLCPDESKPEYHQALKTIKELSKDRKRHVIRAGGTVLQDPFFSELSSEALLYFCQHTRFKSFSVNKTILKQGDNANSLMLVVSGNIELSLNGQKIPEVKLGEGEIIGEMGLFNPAGRKRTATLESASNSVTLEFDYSALQPKENDISAETKQSIEKFYGAEFLKPEKNLIIEEIREQVWRLYQNRTKQNQIRNIQILHKNLSDEQFEDLVNQSEILPERHYEKNISVSPYDIWNYLILIVEGSITVYTTGGSCLTFNKTDWLGIIRLIVNKLPYSRVEVAPHTHFVRLPWEVIEKFLDRESEWYIEDFYKDCSYKAVEVRRRFQ